MTRILSIPALAAAFLVAAVAGNTAVRAEDEPVKVEAAKADDFNTRLFGVPVGKTTTYACFVRRYDATHLAQHPKQKVAAMKLLVTAEYPPQENQSPYSFKLGFKYRNSKANWDSGGYCGHILDKDSGYEVRMKCGVECDGGGIEIGLAKDADAMLVRIERVRAWQNSKPNEEGHEKLMGSTDDRVFRLERTNLSACESLVDDKDERVALRAKYAAR